MKATIKSYPTQTRERESRQAREREREREREHNCCKQGINIHKYKNTTPKKFVPSLCQVATYGVYSYTVSIKHWCKYKLRYVDTSLLKKTTGKCLQFSVCIKGLVCLNLQSSEAVTRHCTVREGRVILVTPR